MPNLMIGFGIDETQAEYVAEIRLRHLNREYILKRTEEIGELEKAIADLEDILKRPARINRIIMAELTEVAKKYGKPRRCEILYDLPEEADEEEVEQVPEYAVHLFFTREGYFKKITPQSLRMSGEQKLKDGDEIAYTCETTNSAELLFFTNHARSTRPARPISAIPRPACSGTTSFGARHGGGGSPAVHDGHDRLQRPCCSSSSRTASAQKCRFQATRPSKNRRKLLKAFSDKAELAAILHLQAEQELAIFINAGPATMRLLLIGSALIPEKATRDTAGVNVVNLKKNARIERVRPAEGLELAEPAPLPCAHSCPPPGPS